MILDIFDKSKYVDEATRRRRMMKCESCPHLLRFSRQCGKCGCLVFLKVKLVTEKCPVGKW